MVTEEVGARVNIVYALLVVIYFQTQQRKLSYAKYGEKTNGVMMMNTPAQLLLLQGKWGQPPLFQELCGVI